MPIDIDSTRFANVIKLNVQFYWLSLIQEINQYGSIRKWIEASSLSLCLFICWLVHTPSIASLKSLRRYYERKSKDLSRGFKPKERKMWWLIRYSKSNAVLFNQLLWFVCVCFFSPSVYFPVNKIDDGLVRIHILCERVYRLSIGYPLAAHLKNFIGSGNFAPVLMNCENSQFD